MLVTQSAVTERDGQIALWKFSGSDVQQKIKAYLWHPPAQAVTYTQDTAHRVLSDNPYQYTGRENDKIGHLMYYRNRYYDTDKRRWLSEDPIGIQGGINLYGYVGGNPVNRVDPLGLTGSGKGGNGTSYFGAEGHFFAGGGLTSVTCTDECGKEQTFRYVKVCFGGAVGGGASGGQVYGMSGKTCNSDRYKGWFFELGASLGSFSAGVDVGYNNNGSLSGVGEVGGGLGRSPPRMGWKASWCYYFPLQ